jgi:hypothetical protein
MRKIDWEAPLSDEDIAWIRQAGIRTDAQIEAHQAQFGEDVPDLSSPDDSSTQSALDPQGKARGVPVDQGDIPVDEGDTPGRHQADEIADDYDSWKVAELREEVTNRNRLSEEREDVTSVNPEGNTKPELIKALRIWDDENPGVI